MSFITFIYRIENSDKVFYGKYVCDYVSDDHEGLDNEIKSIVIDGINAYRIQKGVRLHAECLAVVVNEYKKK